MQLLAPWKEMMKKKYMNTQLRRQEIILLKANPYNNK